jgi:transglutaminase-like putative cysteine protease
MDGMIARLILSAFVVAAAVVLSLGDVIAADGPKPEQAREGTSANDKTGTAGPRVVPGSEQEVSVVFTVRIIHSGQQALKEPEIRMRLPLSCPQQDVNGSQIEGQPWHKLDRWKEPVIVYRQPELSPGQVMTGRWTCDCRIRELKWNLADRRTGGAPALSENEKTLYLRDAKNFAIGDPTIQAAAKEATAGRSDDVSKLEGIYDFVMDRLKYARDGRWDPAPKVLAAGKGSCSEYTYLFVALCRASGIPARYVGGIASRTQTPFHVDLVYHRYSQAFVEGVGWVDFDPTRNKRSKNRRLFFGRTPRQVLLLSAGDGGKGSLTGWDYRCLERWNDKKKQEDDDGQKTPNYVPTVAVRVGWWFTKPPAEIQKKVAEFRKTLAEASPEQRRTLIDEAVKIGHPLVLPWLDDLLYDPATRVEAAKAFLKIGGKESVVAVVDTLMRQNDREGDRQIGELLNAFTGKDFGPDRKKWKKWIKTNTPPSVLPES